MGWRASPSCHHSMIVDPVLGCSSAVPLVPLTEENEEAMENEQFQQLLIKLGVRPPASGQVSTPVLVRANRSEEMQYETATCLGWSSSPHAPLPLDHLPCYPRVFFLSLPVQSQGDSPLFAGQSVCSLRIVCLAPASLFAASGPCHPHTYLPIVNLDFVPLSKIRLPDTSEPNYASPSTERLQPHTQITHLPEECPPNLQELVHLSPPQRSSPCHLPTPEVKVMLWHWGSFIPSVQC